MKKAVVIALVLAVLAAIVVFIFVNNRDKQPANTPAGSSQAQDQEPTASDEEEPAAALVTITYTSAGFSPANYTVAVGGMVTVVNNSDSVLDFASDEHPVHTDNPELNAGSIEPGQSAEFTVTAPGVWGFHNHEFETHTGTLTVQSQ